MTHALEKRLRQALAETSDAPPRPVSSLELPLKMDRLLTPALLRSLRPAAVLVPVLQRAKEPTVLLTRRADHLRSHKGQISFPGGRRDEEDASIAANALREAEEEVGLSPRHVEVIGYLDDYPTMTRYLVTPVVGIVSGEPALRPHEGEVAEVFEVPLAFVLDETSFERKVLSRDGLNLPFFELNYGPHRIWGATAGMLWNLAQKVRG
ncbi:MAG: CoA pyrophosphatase [Nevskiaceae bacterium]|nr:MAG: CoA pyrophosphatase [Nevskiaceae bacterium]